MNILTEIKMCFCRMSNISFSPFAIRGSTIKNRFIRSATWENLCKSDGTPTTQLFDKMKELADGEVGLIISSGAFPSQESISRKGQLGMTTVEQAKLWKPTIQYIHSKHGKFFFQINHCGCRIEPDCLNERIPKGASGLLDLTNKKSESLSNSEIEDIISQFIKCAKLCEYAGADGVQLHSAHGYLLSEFLSPRYNHRNDKWGLLKSNDQVRLVRTIASEIKREIDKDFPVSIKINGHDCIQNGITPKIAATYINELTDVIDLFEISCVFCNNLTTIRSDISPNYLLQSMIKSHHFKSTDKIDFNYENDLKLKLNKRITNLLKNFDPSYKFSEGYNVQYAKEIRKMVKPGTVLSVVGGNRDFSKMSDIITNRTVNFVSMSRPFIRQPHILRTYQDALTTKSDCTSCGECFLASPEEELKPVICSFSC